jgi:hypothetical protein
MTMKRITTTLAALTLVGTLGACGGSDGGDGGDDVASVSGDQGGESAQSDEADTEQELLDWVECMRGQGIDIPDPTRDSSGNLVLGGDPGAGGGGDEPDRDEMAAARETCGDAPLPPAQNVDEEDQQAMQDAALEFAECMRDEGIEDFPDPDFSNTGPGGDPQDMESSQSGGTDGDGGESGALVGPFGELDLSDPEVKAAFDTCENIMADAAPEGAEKTQRGEVPEGAREVEPGGDAGG